MITKEESNFASLNCLNQDLLPSTNFTLFIRKVMNNIKESSDVNEVILAIQNLHKLFKYEEKLFIHTFHNVYDEFQKFLFNENLEIVKASLYLICDVFSVSWLIEQVKEWVIYLIPQIIKLKISIENSLDEESKFLLLKCLDNIPKVCFYEETPLALINAMTNKNSDYTNTACDLFRNFMINADKSYIIDGYEWNEIFENIFCLFHISNKKTIIGENIFHFFKNEIFTNEEWEDILAKLDDNLLENLIIIIKFNYSSVKARKKKLESEIRGYGGKTKL